MRWLHISDIHFNYKNYETEDLRNKLINTLKEVGTVDFIVITGDILYQYDSNDKIVYFVEAIRKACNCQKNKIFICPGNHDINRADNKRNELIDQIRKREKSALEIKANDFDKLKGLGHEEFKYLYKTITGKNYESFKCMEYKANNNKYRIVSLDSCLLSKDNLDDKQINVCCDKLIDIGKKIKDDDYLNIAIMHHGIDFHSCLYSRNFQHWAEDNHIDMVLCGHSHQAGIRNYDETKSEIKQFTCGAGIIDDHAIPTFFVSSFNKTEWKVEIEMYTYSKNSHKWITDNHHLRTFNDGKYVYFIPRKHKKTLTLKKDEKEYKAEEIIKIERNYLNSLNESFYEKYGKYIKSSKSKNDVIFSINNMFSSLLKIGIPTEKVLIVLTNVIIKITSDEYFSKMDRKISTGDIRNCMYNEICQIPIDVDDDISNYQVQNWAGKYARRYGHNNRRIKIDMENGKYEELSFNFIKETLLRNVAYKVTGCNDYYDYMIGKEIDAMTEEVMGFIQGCELYCIKYTPLENYIIELVTEIPHPWMINDKNVKYNIEYNLRTLSKHINKMNNHQEEEITILEIVYHATCVILNHYTKILGCTDTSPLNILTQSINHYEDTKKRWPVKKHKLNNMSNDFHACNIDFQHFKWLINEIYKYIVKNRNYKSPELRTLVKELCDIALKLKSYLDVCKDNVSFMEKLHNLFNKAEGFMIKQPLRELSNCFWITPNWLDDDIKEYDLQKQILAIIVDDKENSFEDIYKYLLKKQDICSELIFIKESQKIFSKDEKDSIKKLFTKNAYKCLFVNENQLVKMSRKDNLKENLLNLIVSI